MEMTTAAANAGQPLGVVGIARIGLKLILVAVLVLILILFAATRVDFVYTGF